MNVMKYKTAIRGRQLELIYDVPSQIAKDLENTFSTFFPVLKERIKQELMKQKKGYALRIQVRAKIKLEKFSFEQDRVIRVEQWFPSDSVMILDFPKIHSKSQKILSEILARYDSFVSKGSGWSLCGVQKLSLVFMRFKLFQGGCEKKIVAIENKIMFFNYFCGPK